MREAEKERQGASGREKGKRGRCACTYELAFSLVRGGRRDGASTTPDFLWTQRKGPYGGGKGGREGRKKEVERTAG